MCGFMSPAWSVLHHSYHACIVCTVALLPQKHVHDPPVSPPPNPAVAFRIYDINRSNTIDPPELKRFLVAVMADNPDVDFDEAALDEIVQDTFAEVDLAKDGLINPEEWLAMVQRNPSVISYVSRGAVFYYLCLRFFCWGEMQFALCCSMGR